MDRRSRHKEFFGIGRLKSGVSTSQAEASLNLLGQQLAKEYPDTNEGQSIKIDAPGFILPDLRGAVVSFTWVLMAAVGLVCSSRARTSPVSCSRARPIDAKRSRSVSQWAANSSDPAATDRKHLLSFTGGIAGLLLALWIVKVLLALKPPIDFPLALDVGIDWRVLLFSLAVSVIAVRSLVSLRHYKRRDQCSCAR